MYGSPYFNPWGQPAPQQPVQFIPVPMPNPGSGSTPDPFDYLIKFRKAMKEIEKEEAEEKKKNIPAKKTASPFDNTGTSFAFLMAMTPFVGLTYVAMFIGLANAFGIKILGN